MLYVAVDPGKSTGLTVVDDEKYVFGCTVDEYNWRWLMDKLEELTKDKNDVTIITEEYRIYPAVAVRQAMQPAWSAEINGMLEYFVHLNVKKGRNYKIVRQWSANAKNYATDEKLKAHGLWKGNRHQKDSARHLVYFLENAKSGTQKSARRKVT